MVNRKLFRTSLTEVKEQFPQRPAHGPQPQAASAAAQEAGAARADAR